jgi:hypothetical protein
MSEATFPTQTEVLGWLHLNYPELHAIAELDRAWVWLPVNLSDKAPQFCAGHTNAEVRQAIGKHGYGFRYAADGHPLESGNIGTWGHHCESPIPFKRRSRKRDTDNSDTNTNKEESKLEERAHALFGF